MSEKNSRNKETRTRNWTCIVYPDSAPSNWIDIINDYHIEWICSPIHDKDLNATGEPKKAHYHILLLFGGVKSYEQVLELLKPLNCTIPERNHNAKALVRYMAHLDNPEKFQYSVGDIKSYGGVDLAELLKPSSSERYFLVKEMLEFVKSESIIEYQDLVDYALCFRFDDWFPLLCDNCTYVVNQYIKSARHRSIPFINPETGEILNKTVGDLNKG